MILNVPFCFHTAGYGRFWSIANGEFEKGERSVE